MRIKASKVKPGMVIGRTGRGDKDVSVVYSVHGKKTVECTHFDVGDSYIGLMIGFIPGKEIVEVLTGAEREAALSKCFKDLLRAMHDAEDNVRKIKLIREIRSYDEHEDGSEVAI